MEMRWIKYSRCGKPFPLLWHGADCPSATIRQLPNGRYLYGEDPTATAY
jgi:hypothetical protein